jgi:hypothetical protein
VQDGVYGEVFEFGWGCGGGGWLGHWSPVERVPVPEPLHAVEAREPDSEASGFTKSLSATCSWNFVKRQGRQKLIRGQAFGLPSSSARCWGLRRGMRWVKWTSEWKSVKVVPSEGLLPARSGRTKYTANGKTRPNDSKIN